MALNTLITRKVGMTSTIDENGAVKAVTLLSFDDQTVISVKNTEKDGYAAIQVGTETAKNMNKSLIGHVKNSKVMPKIIREFRLKDDSENTTNVGDKLSADVFSVGDIVDVTGLNKGKGWAGTIKRHNFKRGRKTHGGRSYRRVGSIGSMYPQHVFKGKKMPGQMGGKQVTVKNLKVAIVDTELKVIGVFGAVPGPKKSILMVKGAK